MSQSFLTPDRLFDRPWQPGHGFGRRPSRGRRAFMRVVFLGLCALIAGYLYLTDADRVRSMAQNYLSQLSGGNIRIGSATLSIFEGLRLKDVTILVDKGDQPDSVLFLAQEFHIKYGVRELIAGRIESSQIVAVNPHVYLTENQDTGQWNYQRIVLPPRPARTSRVKPSLSLPEILLRNAQIDYRVIHHGQREPVASMTIEAHVTPSSDAERFLFQLQSHGGDSGQPGSIGWATGSVDRDMGQVTAQLHDIELDRVISMLPRQVQETINRHALNGRVDLPLVTYAPARNGHDATFKVEMELGGVKLEIRPEEWLSPHELMRQQWTMEALGLFDQAGMDGRGTVKYLRSLVQAAPLELEQVSGRFVFTPERITIAGAKGRLEGNLFHIDGTIHGYSPTAPAEIRVASSQLEHIVIPTAPRYISSLPKPVLVIYDAIRPWGKCDVQASLTRAVEDGHLQVAGAVDIVDGGFCYDKFPYPLRGASGRVEFGPDPQTGLDRVKLTNLRGIGVLGGPNQNESITANGLIGPLNGDPAVDVVVEGQSVSSEPVLMSAFPPEVREALALLDADGKGEYPVFRGAFAAHVHKSAGSPHVRVETDFHLFDGAGKMVAFPYYMEHVSGKIHVSEGCVTISEAQMRKGDSSLGIDGVVSWRAGFGREAEPGEHYGQLTRARPDLKIVAKNVPIDAALLSALPKEQRTWLEKVGAQGTFDLSGRVWSDVAGARARRGEEIVHQFDLELHHGSIWPVDDVFAVSDLNGTLRLFPNHMEIKSVTGKRGTSDLSGSGVVAWPENQPSVDLRMAARDVSLDPTLYKMIPQAARSAWDSLHPEGTVDADIHFKGAAGSVAQATTAPTTSPALAGLDLEIRPRKLAVTVDAFPYRLTDLQGAVRLSNGNVLLQDVRGRHGVATVRATGDGSAQKIDWDLKISADGVAVDADLRKAVPASLGTIIDAMKLQGTVAFEFPKLKIRAASAAATRPATQATSNPASTPLDVDFLARISSPNVSMYVGVPLTDVNPSIELAGTVRDSKLEALAGPVDASSAKIAGRPINNLHLELYKPQGADALRVGNIRTQLGGGEVAGNIDVGFPESGASRYIMNLVVKGADMRALTGDKELNGEVNASLALEGDWSGNGVRRGRGDVSVSGKELYKMPLMLGLMQITNLSLPITSPFNEGSTRYNVDGQKVTFESIEVRSKNMLISGSGQLDFGTKRVNLTFTTDNPNWPKLPILGDMVQTAKNEMMQIHVKGTLQDPKVSANPVSTVTTTVDEVFKGNGK